VRQRRTTPGLIDLDADENRSHEPADAAQDPHAEYVNRVDREWVRAAIQQLPEEFREIIILREYEDLSYQEIAALLRCPQGTVMSRLARARSKLRDLLSGGRKTPPMQEKEINDANGTAHGRQIAPEVEPTAT
jgi:RNA polymerase sigma-70 factor (ECF subfamily)